MFQFADQFYLYFLFAILVYLFLFITWNTWKKKMLIRFGNKEIIDKLVSDKSLLKPITKFILLAISFTFIVLALARPQVGGKLEELKRNGIDMVIALDVSKSMLAEDIKPNRLERSKQSIFKLIEKLKGDQVGLVLFAGEAVLNMPVTSDLSALKLFLESASSESVNIQGTAVGEAIKTSVIALQKYSKRNKAIILITDGENFEDDALEQAKLAQAVGVKVFCLGVGLTEGAPIPNYTNGLKDGFKRNKQGEVVITKPDAGLLRQIAEAGKGKFVQSNSGNVGLDELFAEINLIEKSSSAYKSYKTYDEKYQFFLAIGLFFLLIEIFIFERRSQLSKKIKLFKA